MSAETTQTAFARITGRKETRRGVRLWFRCDVCKGYGDCSGSVAAAEWAANAFVDMHTARCSPDAPLEWP